MVIRKEIWTCPTCSHVTTDEIDDELGPFFSSICDKCNQVFDKDDLEIQTLKLKAKGCA